LRVSLRALLSLFSLAGLSGRSLPEKQPLNTPAACVVTSQPAERESGAAGR
jgi:hypothetical protein